MTWIILALAVAVAFWAIARFYLDGEDLRRFDLPAVEPVNDAPSADNAKVLDSVRDLARAVEQERGRAQLYRMREAMDSMGEQADLTGVDVTSVTIEGRPAEWVTASGRASVGRLLYIHGGAFTMGSPLSHRTITSELARRTGLSVLAVDYRLMPEHSRMAGIEDCRNAYRWMLNNGPRGTEPAGLVFVAGDSAGGNLTLTLIAWLRDQVRAGEGELRQVDGAIALSPLTDATFGSPSMHYNVKTDPLLGAMAKQILQVPRPLMLWLSWLQNRIRPSDPRVSPARGDLSDLPPVLVQASEAEILIDDARRYANKARDAGSPVEIETWHGMVHVWPAFGPGLPETGQAFDRMETFVSRVLEVRDAASAEAGRAGLG